MTPSVADALIGRVIDGRYRILSHLADGGMASVYVAMDGRLEREVALKVMRPGLAADEVFVERFRAEARSAARLSHPNVVAVFDQGEDGGDVFLTMELVQGKTLREVIHEEAPLTAREALAILEPVLLALRAAHGAGMVHRDVKPENVIVRRDGEVKVADFGLARAITNQSATSQTGVLLGTVSYLSPEQVEHGHADARSDLYAAGLLLFEMLTGRKAVTGDTPIQIAYQHVHGSVPVPSSVVGTVPAALDDLVARATALDPDDRFTDAAAMVATLRQVRRSLTSGQLDRRGEASTPADGSTARLPAVSPTSVVGGVGTGATGVTGAAAAADPADPAGAADDDGAVGAPTRASDGAAQAAAAAPAASRPRLAGLPVHEDGPVVERTTAMPIDRRRDLRGARAAGGRGGAGGARRSRWPWWLAAALLVLAGAGTWWFTAGPGGSTVVPAVAGQPIARAQASLEAAALGVDQQESFSETVPKGTVLRVEPAAGTELSKQATVRVVVSKGRERYTVPRLVGTPAAGVGAALGRSTLRLGERTRAWSETVPEGTVVSQDPAPGASVKRNATVSIVVSKGREPLTVPDVRGATVDAATATLTAAGFQVKRAEDVNDPAAPAGQVVAQDPAKGTLNRGDTVTITASKGPVMVPVPNVLDQQDAAAEKALTDLGFKVEKQYPFGDLFEKKVRAQNPPGGTPVPQGSTVVLTIV